jgi:hypothetical protein
MTTIEIGTRVSGHVQGQAFTGTVIGTGGRGGRFALREGKLTEVEPSVLESVTVKTDSPLTTPSGRQVSVVILRGDEIAQLTVVTAGIWILTKGIIQEGGEVIGVWTGPNAKDAANTYFDQIAWTVNSNPNEITRGDGEQDTDGTAYVSGRDEWLHLDCVANGWTKGR